MGPYQCQSFQELKTKLSTAPILQFPNPKLPYTVVTDASGIAVGGVLMQDQGNGLRPLAFMCRVLKPTEQRYSAYKRELAAVAYYFIQWRHYLEGCLGGVTVITDHQPSLSSCSNRSCPRYRPDGSVQDSFNQYSQQSGTNPGRSIYSRMHYPRAGERNSQDQRFPVWKVIQHQILQLSPDPRLC